jgi:hypothetical protein
VSQYSVVTIDELSLMLLVLLVMSVEDNSTRGTDVGESVDFTESTILL